MYLLYFSDRFQEIAHEAHEMKDAFNIVRLTKTYFSWANLSFDATEVGLSNQRFRNIMDSEGFDTVIFRSGFAGEIGYHIAHRHQAHAVLLMFSQSIIFPGIAWSLGMPHNPSHLLSGLTNYAPPLLFWQRVVNVVLHGMHVLER